MSEKLTMTPARPGRRITISLSPPALAGGIIGLCTGFVLIFTLGVLLGRGHNLERSIPELERILPERATHTPPQIIAADETQPAPRQTADNAAPEEGRPAGVISRGDLGYRDNLKQTARPARPAVNAAKTERQTDTGKQKSTANAAKNAGRQAPGAAPAPPTPARSANPAKATDQAKAAGARPSGDTQVYRYVYQVAAYKDEAACAAFANTLKKAGFNARVQKSDSDGTVWYRTMIDFTGRPDDTDTLRDNLKKYDVPRALLKSKTPVR